MDTHLDRVDLSESAIPGTAVIPLRCINCGGYVDDQILANRKDNKPPT